jgi:hypothetical protein
MENWTHSAVTIPALPIAKRNKFMSDDNPPPNSNAPTGILWLFVAFIPSVVGIICFQTKSGLGLLPILVIVNIGCSIFGAAGVVRGIKSEGTRIVLGVLLMPVFFVLNAFIVLAVGCSGMGRIAP